MTKREAAIVSAYTGILLGELSDIHTYLKEIMGRPVFAHELGDEKFLKRIKEKAKPDFTAIKVE